jgi:hypothetical protein
LGRIIDLGVREGDTFLIWGYAEGYNPDLGVHEYQKVENPCSKIFLIYKPTILKVHPPISRISGNVTIRGWLEITKTFLVSIFDSN